MDNLPSPTPEPPVPPQVYLQNPQETSKARLLVILLLALIGLIVIAGLVLTWRHYSNLQKNATTPNVSPVSASQALSIVNTVLTNMAANGTDQLANGGLGGLWIDFDPTAKPLLANGGACSVTNSVPTCSAGKIGHDPLTDIRFLHNLLSYRDKTGSHEFDGTIHQYAAILKADYAGSGGTDPHGIMYDEWQAIYASTKDPVFNQYAEKQADYIFTKHYHEIQNEGAIYDTSQDQNGSYQVADAALMAASLIQAGQTYDQPQWTAAGVKALSFIHTYAYIASYHTYLHFMGNVVVNGAFNQDESIEDRTITKGSKSYAKRGGIVKPGEIGDIAVGFLEGYKALKGTSYDSSASQFQSYGEDALSALSDSDPYHLQLWDPADEGYYFGTFFAGTTRSTASSPSSSDFRDTKEDGRQFSALRGYALAASIDPKFQSMTNELLAVAIDPKKAFDAQRSGYSYSVHEDWSPTVQPDGHIYVTTEAMGIVCEALLQAASR